MPTQPVVWACKTNVMLSPLTVYVTLYAPFDKDLTPRHKSASGNICMKTFTRPCVCMYCMVIPHYCTELKEVGQALYKAYQPKHENGVTFAAFLMANLTFRN